MERVAPLQGAFVSVSQNYHFNKGESLCDALNRWAVQAYAPLPDCPTRLIHIIKVDGTFHGIYRQALDHAVATSKEAQARPAVHWHRGHYGIVVITFDEDP